MTGTKLKLLQEFKKVKFPFGISSSLQKNKSSLKTELTQVKEGQKEMGRFIKEESAVVTDQIRAGRRNQNTAKFEFHHPIL